MEGERPYGLILGWGSTIVGERAAREGYEQIFHYLGVGRIIDQFLLGKAYLGLLMCQAHTDRGGLPAVFRGEISVPPLAKPAEHVFSGGATGFSHPGLRKETTGDRRPKVVHHCARGH